jgi:hypothetical protein
LIRSNRTVEQDQAREAREPLEEAGDPRLGPQMLNLLQLRCGT